LMRLIGYGDFNATDYQNEYERLRRGTPKPRALTPGAPSSGVGSSGKMVLGISLKNGQVVIDVLNDSGGAGGSQWYKPNDPDYLKWLQSSGQLPKGNG